MRKLYFSVAISFAFSGNIHAQFADVRLVVDVSNIYMDYCRDIIGIPEYTAVPYVRLNEEQFKGSCITKDGDHLLGDDPYDLYNEDGLKKVQDFGKGKIVFEGITNAQFLEHRLRAWEDDVGDRCGYGSNLLGEDDCYWDSDYATFNFRMAVEAGSTRFTPMGFRHDGAQDFKCDGLNPFHACWGEPIWDNIDPENIWQHGYAFRSKWNYVLTSDAAIVNVPFCGDVILQYPKQQINARQVNLKKGISYSMEILSKNNDIITVAIYNEANDLIHTIFNYNDLTVSYQEYFQTEEDGVYFIEAFRDNTLLQRRYPTEDVNLKLNIIETPTITEIPTTIRVQTDPEICGKIINYPPIKTDAYCFTTIQQINGLPSGSRFPVGTTINTFQLIYKDVVEDIKSFSVVVTTAELLTLETKDIHTNLPEGGVLVLTPEQVLSDSIDICELKSFALSKDTFTCDDEGSNIVTVTATDYYDNVFSNDIEVFIYPQTIVKTLDEKSLRLNLYGDEIVLIPSAIDNGSFSPCWEKRELEFSLNRTYFDCEDIGKDITVTLSIKDPDGNITTGTTKINVYDSNVPEVKVRDIFLGLDENGEVSLTADQLDAGSWDNCGIDIYSLSKYNFNTSNLGANEVSLSITDVNGNTGAKFATVTVVAFSELNTQDLVIGIGEDGTAKVEPDDIYLSSPNLGTIFNYSFDNFDKTDFICTDVGKEFTVQLTVEDIDGKTATNFANVTVEDQIPPTLGGKSITVELNIDGRANITLYDITDGSYDNCGPVDLSLSKYNFSTEDIGDNKIILTGRDNNGLTSELEVIVTVKDYQGPIIITRDSTVLLDYSGNVNIDIHDVYTNFIYTSPLRSYGISKESYNCGDIGENIVEITLTFSDGAVATSTATVTVKDIRAPGITCFPILVYASSALGSVVNYEYPVAFDNCEVSKIYLTGGLPSGEVFPIGTTMVSYEAIDASGNVSSCSFEVKVQANVSTSIIHPPLITVGNDPGSCGAIINLNEYVEVTNGSTPTFEPASGSLFPVGRTPVLINNNSYIFYVEVIDSEDVELTFDNNEAFAGFHCHYYVPDRRFDPYFADNCKNAEITNSINQSGTLYGEDLMVGDHVIIWTVTMPDGEVSTFENTVHIYNDYDNIYAGLDILLYNSYEYNNGGKTDVAADEGNCSYLVKGTEMDAGIYEVCPDNRITLINNINGTATLKNEVFEIGTTNVTWTLTYNKNQSIITATYPITVTGTIEPKLSGTYQRDIEIGKCFYQVQGTEFDAAFDYSCFGGSVSNDYNSTATLENELLTIGINKIIWRVNTGDNINYYESQITIADPTPLSISCPENILIGAISSSGAIVDYPLPTISNSCNVTTSLIKGLKSGSEFPMGETLVEYAIENFSGDFQSCSFLVTVNEDGPINTCPGAIAQDVVVQLDANGNGLTRAELVYNGSNDPCGIASLELSKTEFTCTDIGSNNVILKLTDNNGNVSTATAGVRVEDHLVSTAVAKNITVQLDATGNVTITPSQVDNGSSDACGEVSLALDKASFDCTNLGANAVVLTVTDSNSNKATANATVTVEDKQVSSAVAQNIAVQLDATGNVIITPSQVDNGSSDACGEVSLTLDINSFNCTNLGANAVVLTVTDSNSNKATANATVTVEDKQVSSAVAQNIAVQLDATGKVTITPSQVDNGSSDACGEVSLTLDINSFNCTNLGVNAVVLTVTDSNGNIATANATVTVEDKQVSSAVAKNITVHLDATGNVTITPSQVDNGSSDACGEVSLALDIISFDCTNLGVNAVVLTVSDSDGNSATANAIVTVEDTFGPTVATQNITVHLDSNGSASITAAQIDNGSTDNCEIASYDLDITDFDCSTVGLNLISLKVIDVNGNFSIANAKVTVKDEVLPIIVCVENDIRYLDPYNIFYIIQGTEFNATATDNCGTRAMEYMETGTNNVGGSLEGVQLVLGDHTYEWTAVDSNENTSSCPTLVTVQKRPTSISYQGDISEQYSDRVDLSATLMDDLSGIGVENQEVIFTIGSQFVATTTNENGVASATLVLNQAPGTYSVKVKFAETYTYLLSHDSSEFYILQEDAAVEYTGQTLQATNSSRDPQTTLLLIANIQDITANPAYPDYDEFAGEIINAKVMFVDRDNGNSPISGWLDVNIIDTYTGTVNYNWAVDIGNASAESFTIGIIVDNGYYTRNTSEDDSVVTVYIPTGDFITGGGYINPSNSYGLLASTEGLKTNFGFNVRYNKTGTKLKGHMNVIFRRLENDETFHVYQIKGNAIQSLGVDTADETAQFATFITKSNLTDITDPGNPVSLGGNLLLKVEMIDRGEPGTEDSISITLTEGNGSLLFASNWNGISNEEIQLSKGNIVVHSGFSIENSLTTEIKAATTSNEEDVIVQVLDFAVAPNPSDTFFTVKIISENQKDRVRLVVHSYTGSILYETSGKATDEINFGERFAAGTYIVKVYQAGQTVEKVVIKI